MLFKLIAAVLAVSDTGSVATSMVMTDMPGNVCAAVKQNYFSQDSELTVNGHRITIKPKADCIPLGVPSGPDIAQGGDIPPPIAGMINGFLGGFRR